MLPRYRRRRIGRPIVLRRRLYFLLISGAKATQSRSSASADRVTETSLNLVLPQGFEDREAQFAALPA